MSLKKSLLCATAGFAATIVGTASPAGAVLIDVNQSFINFENANSGPTPAVNGNFQYGTAPAGTTVAPPNTSIAGFAQYLATEHTDNLGGFNPAIQGYDQANSTLTPFAVVNVDTANPQTICCGITLQPSEIGLHPDNGGAREYSVILWTAPSNGTFTDSATYADRGGNVNTAVYLQDPSGTQASPINNASLNSSGSILAGQTIAFLVGIGPGGFGANSTGLYATINFTPIPEPASLGLLGLSGLGLLARRRRA